MQFLVSSKMQRHSYISGKIPASYQKHRLPGAHVTFTSGPFGCVLCQEITGEDWTIQQQQFFISRTVRLYPYTNRPLVALHCMMAGSIPCLLEGYGKLLLREQAFGIYYIPAAGHNIAFFTKGYFESFHIAFSPAYLSFFARQHTPLKDILLRMQDTTGNGAAIPSFPLSLKARSLIDQIRHTTADRDRQILHQSRINDLMLQYAATLEGQQRKETPTTGRHERTIQQLADHILENLEKPLSVPTLARMAGLHVLTLEREFKRTFHQTLISYIQRQRLERAAMLLTADTAPVSEVAFLSGYSDPSYFGKVFKQRYGNTPSTYRKKWKKATDNGLL